MRGRDAVGDGTIRALVLALALAVATVFGLIGCGGDEENAANDEPVVALALDYASQLQELSDGILEQAALDPDATTAELATASGELEEIATRCRDLAGDVQSELPSDFPATGALLAASRLSARVAQGFASLIEELIRIEEAFARAQELAAEALQRLEQAFDELLAALDQLERQLGQALASLLDALRPLTRIGEVDRQQVLDVEGRVRDARDAVPESGRNFRETAQRRKEEAAPTGPIGPLEASNVGPVELGMTEADVEELFGPPDSEEEVNFGGGPTAPQVDWIWTYDDGDFRLNFDTATGAVTGYSSETSSLETAFGVTVGESFSSVEERYGDQLAPSPIGTAFLLSEGEPGTYPALTFAVQGGTIIAINGGELQSAGE